MYCSSFYDHLVISMVSETVLGMAYCVVQYCVPWSSLSSFYISVCGLLLLRSSVRRQIVLPQCIVFFFDCSSSLIKHPIGNPWQPTITLYSQNMDPNTREPSQAVLQPPPTHWKTTTTPEAAGYNERVPHTSGTCALDECVPSTTYTQ